MQRPWGGRKHIDWEGHSGCTAKLRECVISVETKEVVKHIQTFLQEVFLDR